MRATEDEQIAALYAVPPEDFVRERDALVRRLRASGERDAAERVCGLRRPSPALWAVNQLAKAEPGALAALTQAAEGLRSAQGRLLAGERDVELTNSAQAHRDAVGELAEAGRRLLAAEGRPVTPSMVERIRRTLHSASLLEEARGLLEQGRLTGEVPAGGFGLEGDLAERPEPRRRRPDPQAENEERRRREEERLAAERVVEDTERRRDVAHERLREARASVERVEAEHASAERALAAAQEASARATEALAAAREAEERAILDAGQAEVRVQRARADETDAATTVERAQAEVEAARADLRSLPGI